jgi:glycosyltransferase involved in cell wall biosynthesis
MKVAILSATDIYANNGGVESYLKNYIAFRIKQGDDVTVISTEGKVKSKLDLFLKTFTFAFKKHDLREYDEVYTNTHSFQLFIKSGKTVSIWHGSGLQRFLEDWRAFFSPYTYLDAFLEVLDLMFSPTIYAVSRHTSNFIHKDDNETVMYPIAADCFVQLRNEKIQDGYKRILFVGDPKNKRKGFAMMLKALELLPENFKLIVCGGNNVEIATHKNHQIEYMGTIENNKMPKFYSMCDCYCLPTTYEGTPLTVIEAIACKCPVVATKVGGIPEIVKEKDGYIARYDAKDIANGIMSVTK